MALKASSVPGHARHRARLVLELALEAFLRARQQQVLRLAERQCRAAAPGASPAPRPRRARSLGGHDPVDEARRDRLFRAQSFVEHVELRRAARAHAARQEITAAAVADDADAGKGGVEFGVRGGEHEIRAGGQRDGAARREPVHRDDDGRVHAREARYAHMQIGGRARDEAREILAAFAQRVEVAADAEETPLGVDQHRAHVRRAPCIRSPASRTPRRTADRRDCRALVGSA